jgi:type II secretory ATPase GspE/PulE/Tfp pilus assembly ATPase PilB-like protein
MLTDGHFSIDEILLNKGIVTPQQLEQVFSRQKDKGILLNQALQELGFIKDEQSFLTLLAQEWKMPLINLKETKISTEALARIPAKAATYYKVIPVAYVDGTLTVATNQPYEIQLLDEIAAVCGSYTKTVIAPLKDILEAIRQYYGVGAETIEQMMGSVQVNVSETSVITELDELDSDASISKFINQILIEAYKEGATDIHIEPFEDALQIRYRIDGSLSDAKVPKNIKLFKDAIISRIKILSQLNIAEKRKPQDGRFKVRLGSVDLDLRVSFLPTPYGESVVLRVLNSTKLFTLDELGLLADEKKILERLIQKPHGIVFLTGPTGSGKTTTLYSCLALINTEDKKIITIEDPVEYQLKGIVQMQINPAVGLTFANGLRSMLRHDPDIMMVGEVRDVETAEIAIQVALTGHLVFSTLHTNDAASAVTRLLDMGIDPYLITSTVECFIAQRLVRVVCKDCVHQVKGNRELLAELGVDSNSVKDFVYREGKGCENCNQSGYSGREPIFEFLVLNDDVRKLIMERSSSEKVKMTAVARGMRTLMQSGWEKIKLGKTTPQEVLRVTQEGD